MSVGGQISELECVLKPLVRCGREHDGLTKGSKEVEVATLANACRRFLSSCTLIPYMLRYAATYLYACH